MHHKLTLTDNTNYEAKSIKVHYIKYEQQNFDSCNCRKKRTFCTVNCQQQVVLRMSRNQPKQIRKYWNQCVCLVINIIIPTQDSSKKNRQTTTNCCQRFLKLYLLQLHSVRNLPLVSISKNFNPFTAMSFELHMTMEKGPST